MQNKPRGAGAAVGPVADGGALLLRSLLEPRSETEKRDTHTLLGADTLTTFGRQGSEEYTNNAAPYPIRIRLCDCCTLWPSRSTAP